MGLGLGSERGGFPGLSGRPSAITGTFQRKEGGRRGGVLALTMDGPLAEECRHLSRLETAVNTHPSPPPGPPGRSSPVDDWTLAQ